MAVVAALRTARDLPADAVVVVLLPDHGRGYLNRFYDDDWMRDHGFETGAAAAGSGAHLAPEASGTTHEGAPE